MIAVGALLDSSMESFVILRDLKSAGRGTFTQVGSKGASDTILNSTTLL